MNYEEMINSEGFMIELGRFVEKLDHATRYHTSWKDLPVVDHEFGLDGNQSLVIELVPSWARSIEELNSSDPLELFNDFNDTNYQDDGMINWYSMNILIRVLNFEDGTEETTKIYWFDKEGNLIKL